MGKTLEQLASEKIGKLQAERDELSERVKELEAEVKDLRGEIKELEASNG